MVQNEEEDESGRTITVIDPSKICCYVSKNACPNSKDTGPVEDECDGCPLLYALLRGLYKDSALAVKSSNFGVFI